MLGTVLTYVHQRETHANKNDKSALQVAQEEQDGAEDAQGGQSHVAVHLHRDDLVCLPGGVAQRHGKHLSS